MKRQDFEAALAAVEEKAGSMWQIQMATCPDDHLQVHVAEVRRIVREHGWQFNSVVWAGDYYGFYWDGEVQCVAERREGELVIHSDPDKGPDYDHASGHA